MTLEPLHPDDTADPLDTARGIGLAVVLSVPLWACLVGLGWAVVWLVRNS